MSLSASVRVSVSGDSVSGDSVRVRGGSGDSRRVGWRGSVSSASVRVREGRSVSSANVRVTRGGCVSGDSGRVELVFTEAVGWEALHVRNISGRAVTGEREVKNNHTACLLATLLAETISSTGSCIHAKTEREIAATVCCPVNFPTQLPYRDSGMCDVSPAVMGPPNLFPQTKCFMENILPLIHS